MKIKTTPFFLFCFYCVLVMCAWGAPPFKPSPETGILSKIHECAASGNTEKMQEILAQKPNAVDYKDPDGWTPLAYAARFGQKAMVEFLISRNAKINVKDSHGFTPLHQAASYDQVEIIEILLKKGAEINARTEGMVTPRRLATANGSKRAAKLLGDRGGFN